MPRLPIFPRFPHLAVPILLLAAPVAGQQARGGAYVVDRWTAETGLPQNTVNAITQTPDGYLWLATFGGLVRFDGVTFTTYSAARYPGIHSDRALALCVSPDSTLWIGTEDGFGSYGQGAFRSYTTRDGLPPGAVLDVTCDPDGDIWLAMDHQGVVRWHDGHPDHIPITGDAGIGVYSAIPDGQGGAWLGRWGAAPTHLTPADRAVPAPGRGQTVAGAVSPLPVDGKPGLVAWRTADGFVVPGPEGYLRIHPPESIRRGFATFITPRSDGGYWIATASRGMMTLEADGSGNSRIPLPNGDSSYHVRAVFIDRGGVTWVGTEVDGLLRIRRRLFTVLTTADGLSSNLPMGIAGDDAGRVYIGSNCQNLTVLDHGRAIIYDGHREPRVVDGCPWALLHGPGDTIWMGTYGGPVVAWRGSFARTYGAPEGLKEGLALAMFADHQGEIWAGTLAGGVARLHNGRFITYDTTDGLPSNDIKTIAETRAGVMWFGTGEGAARLDGKRFIAFGAADGLAKGPIRAIHESADGALWFGSYGGGLSRLKDGRFVTMTAADGLYEDVVSSITEDAGGYLWTTGNHGIARVSLRELNDFADGQVRAVHAVGYGTADGLINPETNGGFSPNAWKAPDGRIWFPTLHGVAIVDPSRVAASATPPRSVIEGLDVDGRSIPPGTGASAPLLFDPGTRNIDITYTGLQSIVPERIAFRYRFAGDADWTYAGTRRTAYFSRLPPGRYRFEVAAANRDGIWSPAPAALDFTVQPPIWMIWWFRLAALILAAGAVLLLMRRRVAHARAQTAAQREFSRRLLEGQEQERRRIAAELHDSVGQGILVMKNRAVLGLRSPDAIGAAREQLEQISEIASETLNETRTIAHDLRPYQLDRLGLAATVRGAVERAAAGSGILFKVDVDGVDGALPPEAEISLFRIVQEGVTNVIRHSGAREAHIALLRESDTVRLTISDDGRGTDHPAGFGLAGITQRIHLLGGDHEFHSAPGAGTTLVVRIPITPERP
ncbi:MAG: two-component regulator propeller domain-containing protein [Gemmatimonadales bacterium]